MRKTKSFSQFFVPFLDSILTFEHFEKEEMRVIAIMYCRNYRL